MPYYGEDDPRRQRAIQRIAAMPQDKIALYNAAFGEAAGEWGKYDIVQQVRRMAIGNKLWEGRERLKLDKEALDTEKMFKTRKMDVEQRDFDRQKRQDRLAEIIAIGGAGYGARLGAVRRESDIRMAQEKLKLARKYKGLLGIT